MEPALAYWRSEIDQLTADCFSRRRSGSDGACSVTLTSPELLAASRRIAADYQVWPSAVHLTAYAMLTAAYAGTDRVSTLAFTGNRNTSSYPDVLTCMFSPLLMRLDCPADASFAELLAVAAGRFELGQQHSYLPYDECSSWWPSRATAAPSRSGWARSSTSSAGPIRRARPGAPGW